MKRIILFLAVFLITLFSRSQHIVDINFDSESPPFVDGADYGSNTYTSGNIQIIYDVGNWFEDANDGQGNTPAIVAKANTGGTETITLRTVDGSEIDFESFYFNSNGNVIHSIRGYMNGSQIVGQTSGFPAASMEGQIHLTDLFNNVDQVIIMGTAGFNGEIFDNFIFALNTDPRLLNLGPTSTSIYTEGGLPIVLDANVVIEDIELDNLNGGVGNYDGASVTITRMGGANSDDLFTLQGSFNYAVVGTDLIKSGGAIGSFTDDGAGTLTILFSDDSQIPTTADVNAVLGLISYSNNSDNPPSSLTLTYTVNDGNGGVATDNIAVNITPVDDPPISFDHVILVEEDVAYTFREADFPFTDPEDAFHQIYITRKPDKGTLLYNGSRAQESTSYTDRTAFTYQARLNENGAFYDSLDFYIVAGGVSSSSSTVKMNVRPINDPPSITATLMNLTSNSGDGIQQVPNFLNPGMDVTLGPADEETTQAIARMNVVVTYDPNNVIDGSSLRISNSGKLTYMPHSQAMGVAELAIVVEDNGGTIGTGANNQSLGAPFTITVTDNEVPNVLNPGTTDLTPPDGMIGVEATNSLQIIFDENVNPASGNITIYDGNDGSPIASVDVNDPSSVIVTEDTVDINFGNTWLLKGGEEYFVQVPSTAFVDADNPTLAYPGIQDAISWRFRMADASASPPRLLATIPADGQMHVLPNQPIILIFDEPVRVVTDGVDNDYFFLDDEIFLSGVAPLIDDLIGIDISANDNEDFGLNDDITQSSNIVTLDLSEDPPIITHGVIGAFPPPPPLPYNFTTGRFYSFEFEADIFADADDNFHQAISKRYFQIVTETTPPTLAVPTSFFPADDAAAAHTTSEISVFFSEAIRPGNGNIQIYADDFPGDTDPGDMVLDIPSYSPLVDYSISGELSIDVSGVIFSGGVTYYVQIQPGAITDIEGNDYAGFTDETTWNFVVNAETNPPGWIGAMPSDNAAEVPLDSDFVLQFDELVYSGLGVVSLWLSATNSLVQTLDVSELVFDGHRVTIDFEEALDGLTPYYITVPAGAIVDQGGTMYGGFTTATAYNFITEIGMDSRGPIIEATNPEDGAVDVAVDSDITLIFNEAVTIQGGNLELDYAGNGVGVDESFPITAGSVASNIVTIPVGSVMPLPHRENVRVKVSARSFADQFDNDNSSDYSFRFTTEADMDPPNIMPASPVDGATGVGAMDPEFSIDFDEIVNLVPDMTVSILRTGDFQAVAQRNTTSDVGSFTGAGTTSITIDFSGTVLETETEYLVHIPDSVFVDGADNGNEAFGGTNGDWSFTTEADMIPPNLTITLQPVTNGDPNNINIGTSDTQITLNLAFTEPIDDSRFTQADIVLSSTGSLSFDPLTSADLVNSGDNQNYELTITNISGDGWLRVTVSNSNIYDLAVTPNRMALAVPHGPLWFDHTIPRVNALTITSSYVNDRYARVGETITLNAIFDNNDISSALVVSFMSGGEAISDLVSVTGSGNMWVISYVVDAADSDGPVTFTMDFMDNAGNVGVQVDEGDLTSGGTTVTVDKIVPQIMINTLETGSLMQTIEGVISTNGDADENVNDLVIDVAIDGGVSQRATNDQDGTWSLDVTQGVGIYNLNAVVTDMAGNSSGNVNDVSDELQVGGVSLITPSVDDICTDGASKTLEDISIVEQKNNDFKGGDGRTFFLNLPFGFTFDSSVSPDLTTNSMLNDLSVVGTSFIGDKNLRITLDVDNTLPGLDSLVINGLKIFAYEAGTNKKLAFSNGTASIFGFEDGATAATLTSVSPPVVPTIRLSAIGPDTMEVEVVRGQGSRTLYVNGAGPGYRWYDYDGNQISTLQTPSFMDLSTGGASGPTGFDINAAGLYTLYAGTVDAVGCESALAPINIFVYEIIYSPNQRIFIEDEPGTTITISCDKADYDGFFSGPGLTNFRETGMEARADFVPETAGIGDHSIVFFVTNLTTLESYEFSTDLEVNTATTIFSNDPPNEYCQSSSESTSDIDVKITDIPSGYVFFEIGLYDASDVEVINVFTPPLGYDATTPISTHLAHVGWSFDPGEIVGAGTYSVTRYTVPIGTMDPEGEKEVFSSERFTIHAIPTVELNAIGDKCVTDGSVEIIVTLSSPGVSDIEKPVSEYMVTYVGRETTVGVYDVPYSVSRRFFDPADPLDTMANGLSLATSLPMEYPVGAYQINYISMAVSDPARNGCVNMATPEEVSVYANPDKPLLITNLIGVGGLDVDDHNNNLETDDYFLEYCSGDIVNDLESSSSPGEDIRWYSDALGTSEITTGKDFNFEDVFGTKQFFGNVEHNFFFAAVGANGCRSELRRVNVVIYDFSEDDIVKFPESAKGVLASVDREFYYEYCVEAGADLRGVLDDIELFFANEDPVNGGSLLGNLPADGLSYFEIYEGDMTLNQTITVPAGETLSGRTLGIVEDIGMSASASSNVDVVDDTTIYVRRVIYDRQFSGTGDEFAGCEEELHAIHIAVYTRPEMPGEGEFFGSFILDETSGIIEYYMCEGEQFPVRITDPQVSGGNYVYLWYISSFGVPLAVADPFGERPTSIELLGTGEPGPGAYTSYTRLIPHINRVSGFNDGFMDCEGPIRQVNVNVVDVPVPPVVTVSGSTGVTSSEGGMERQVFNFCTDDGQLGTDVSFVAKGAISTILEGDTYFRWYTSNARGDQGTSQLSTVNEAVTALELSISGIANDTHYFLVTQTTNVIGDISDPTYSGCESGGHLVQINYGSIPKPTFTYIGITEGRGTTFDLSDVNNVVITSSELIIRNAFNDVVGSFTTGDTDVNMVKDEYTVSLDPGEYSVEYRILSTSSCSEEVYRKLTILPHYAAGELDVGRGYEETFESGDGGWFAEYLTDDAKSGGGLTGHLRSGGEPIHDDRISSWALISPRGDNIRGGGGGTSIAWVTDQSTRTNYANNGEPTYYGGEVSFVYSPSFDLSRFIRPAIRVWTNTDMDSFRDGVVLQYSVDDGRTWRNVGSFNDGASSGNNWYVNESITSGPGGVRPGNISPDPPYNPNNAGWTDNPGEPPRGWMSSENPIIIPDNLSLDSVRFRFALSATGNNTDTDKSDGFGFDQFKIFQREQVVLLEQFSSSLSEQGKVFANELRAVLNQEASIFINYITDLDNDGMNKDYINLRNVADPNARTIYYGISSVPNVVISGKVENILDIEELRRTVSQFSLTAPLFEIQLEPSTTLLPGQIGLSSATYNFIGSSTSELSDPSTKISFHFVILEPFITGREISKKTADGSQVIYHATDTLWNVVRDMIPDASGITWTGSLTPDREPIVFNDIIWNIRNVYNADTLAMVTYAQNPQTRTIYQAAAIGFSTTGETITGLEALPHFKIYPNPGDARIIVDFGEALKENREWILYDSSGKEALKGEIALGEHRLVVDSKELSSGLYLFHLVTKNQKRGVVKRILVKHGH